MTTTTTTSSSESNGGTDGAWIGIDFGTSNCAAAVWDSSRGRPKLMQLGRRIAIPRRNNTKDGRIVPSCVLVGKGGATIGHTATRATVGFEALKMLQEDESVSKACVTSVKRLIGLDIGTEDTKILNSFPFDVCKEDDGSLSLFVSPIEEQHNGVRLSCIEVVSCILDAIRQDSESYLRRNIRRGKHLQVPGTSSVVTNCVLGVPAHFSRNQCLAMETAARAAGFTGHVSTIIESTAASMAYGLFVSVPSEKHIMVLDMGGGTTDVTIATLTPDKEFTVVATQGDRKLGGDDVDESILNFFMERRRKSDAQHTLLRQDRPRLLLECRKCKEALCGVDQDELPAQMYEVYLDKKESFGTMSQEDFAKCIFTHVQRTQELIESVLHRTGLSIDEVVLVGGGTRVPAIRTMLRTLFPSIPDLCMSLKADGAVAQGAAIQAAIKSGRVPLSELRSALMLDALPHTIGVLRPDGESYEPILLKDAKLPARGHATFALAEATQRGVTVVAVEDVGDGSLERIGEFTFLLHKLGKEDLERMNNQRSVDIGLVMETSGQFVVSIFDKHDPDHLRKKRLRQQQQAGDGNIQDDTEMPQEGPPTILLVAIVILFVFYIAAKLVFHEVETEGLDGAINEESPDTDTTQDTEF